MLAAAVLLVAVPGWARVLGLGAVGLHALRRRPGVVSSWIELQADGLVRLPDRGSEVVRLGPSTRFARGWVRLVDRSGALDVLLLEDQLEAADWARLSAWLRRTVLDDAKAVARGPEAGPPDLS